VPLTTRELRPGPLAARRLAAPAAILAVAAGAVWLLPRLGVPLTVTRFDPAAKAVVTERWGAVAIGIAAAYFAARLLDWAVFDLLLRRRGASPVPALLRQLIGIAVFLIGVSLVFKTILAMSLTALLTTSAIITAVIGLALQDTLGNLFAGLALHLEKALRVGDMVRAGETYGTVEELSWRTIKLRTLEGNVLLVPNALAGRERLEIYPRPGRPIARTLRVGLEYEASPARAREVLEGALRSVAGVVKHPEPVVYLRSFDDHAIAYEVRYWLEDFARLLEVDSRVRERVWYSLDRAGLRIAYPIVRQHQYAAGSLVRPSGRDPLGAILSETPLFAPLSPEERERLAAGASERRFGPEEVIVREGEDGASMFLVQSGRVTVSLHDASGSSRKLTVLEPGSAFGEISLLTGEPRTATVRALTETRLVEIDKETLAPILLENPRLVESLEATMRERRRGAAELREAAPEAGSDAAEHVALAARIARFFGLRSPR
jgi:small-conductance mechanosensitive channel/CRP-like cAMP-binding protein